MSHGGALMPLAIGVDIGGTKVLGGVVDPHGQVLARARREHHGEGSPEAVGAGITAAVIDVIKELAGDHEIGAVGLSAAGFISSNRTTVLDSPNIPGWQGAPLAAQVGSAVGLPVVLENDANCAAWGEARFGAARGRSQVAMITVGTGIGGGIIMDGVLVRGGHGLAGEPGHISLVPDGLPCGCGQRGCWEQYGSGTALVRAAREHGYTGEPGAALTHAAQTGNPAAKAAFADIGGWLGRGIVAICALIDPEVVILGGGVSEAGELIAEPTRAAMAALLPSTALRPHPVIEVAQLGADAGMVGAADLARDRSNS